ncbi:TonB-dependent receptor [Sphingomonas sp. GM_Shp_1]|uniref:TonB-dependent receptor n=1 Tax=Sphingomonas sp. GM_Shp_1 TaxID=2937381 RepID=UPI00226B58B8|nr:TonB-dependent receptor [Sphingomonas sp. GM_Shp_1]
MKRAYLLCAVASIALPGTLFAQTTPTAAVQDSTDSQSDDTASADAPSSGDIIVTGIRASLKSSAAIKRNASQIVDAVSAEDVGKFPDVNIADSLQRVTGVAIDRSGGEGQFITVRGLGPQFNTVLVNGRVMATDNPGREFSFDVLSPNMIQRTEIYKSTVPQLQEGGIGATVNIITAKPLDGKTGAHLTLSAGGMYDTLAKKTSPDFSGTASFANKDKTIGLVVAASYTKRYSAFDQFAIHGWLPGSQGLINGTPSSAGLTAGALINSPANIFTPRDSAFYHYDESRERLNVASTFQAKLSDRLLLTVDGLYSKFNVMSNGHYFGPFFTPRFIGLTANSNGTVNGFNRPGTQFLAANPALTDPALGDQRVTVSQNDNASTYGNRFSNSYQIGSNLKWSVADNLDLKFDASTTQAKNRTPGAFIVVGALAQSAPRFDLLPGVTMPIISNLGNVTDPSLMRAHYSSVGEGRVRDRGTEFHFDGDYRNQDEGPVKSILFGAAFNRRHKTQTNANNEDTVCTYCGYDIPVPANLLSPYTLNNYLPKISGSDKAPVNFLTFDPAAVLAYLSQPSVLALARQGRTAAEQAAVAAQQLALPGGPFGLRDRPGQLLDVVEKVWAGYINVGLGGPRWSGNVGFRVTDTSVVSSGFTQPILGIFVNPGDDNLNIPLGNPTAVSVRNHYRNFLPSANVRYDLTDRMLLRGAFSQTITRPTLTDLGVNNFYNGRVTAATSGGGNPTLRPFKSTNYDLSYEFYISDISYVSLAGFYKEFSDFLEQQTLPIQIGQYTFQDTRTRNGATGSVAGVEVGAQLTADRISSGFFGGFGIAGNYTYVSDTAKRAANTNSACGYNGLSPHSANGSLFYQKYGIQARASYNWRSSFLRSCLSDYGQPENRRAYGQLDFSASYDITPAFQVYVQGVNLTNSYIFDYSVLEERVKNIQNFGTRFNFGVRASF